MPRISLFLVVACLASSSFAQDSLPASTSQPSSKPASSNPASSNFAANNPAEASKPAANAAIVSPPPTKKETAPVARFDGRKQFAAVRAEEPIKLDGLLDEPSWSASEVRGDFVERFPKPGGEARYKTTLKILYDKEALYFGVRCDQPVAPRIRTLRRDSFNLFSDDGVSVKIDPFQDRKTTISFATNAAGAQFDQLTIENGREYVPAFDALWEAETSIDSEGYTIEYKIPFRTLGIPGSGENASVGIDVERRVIADGESYQWSVLPQGAEDNNATFYGDLIGLENIQTGQPLQITPYFLASASPDGPVTSQGLDLKASIGSIGSAQVSFRTDFAQISPDDAFVNLDRFAVALRERRPFFLEGTEIFKFGNSGSDQLFFSRRIGIEDDPSGAASVLVPIDLGVKAQGRSGKSSFGFLNVLTGESPGLEEGSLIDRANFTVVRARRSFDAKKTAGALVAFKQSLPGEGGFATSGLSLGSDGALRLFQEKLGLDGAVSFTHNNDFARDDDNQIVFNPDGSPSALTETGFSAQLTSFYAGDSTNPFFSFVYRTPEYNPTVGFVRRTDIASAAGGVEFVVRPDKKSKVANYSFGPDASINTNAAIDQVLESNVGGFFFFSLRKGFRAFTGGGIGYSFINQDFEPLDGLLIPTGDYFGYGHSIGFSTSARNDISLSINLNSNVSRRDPDAILSADFMNGSLGGNAFVSARMNQHFSATLGFSDDVLFTRIKEQEIEKNRGNVFTLNSGVEVAFNRALTWSTTLQLTDLADPSLFGEGLSAARFFGEGLIQSRLAWRFRPGSDLFLVYNVQQELGIAGEAPIEPVQSLALKISVVLEIAR